jgi:CheY-like chemotaxis protein
MHTSVENTARTPDKLSVKRERRMSTHILIVDDDPDFLELLTNEIGQIEGVEIDVAHSPSEAIERLTKSDYELIVSDWALEKSTGPEVLRQADSLITALVTENDLLWKTPVLFISGSDKVGQTQVLRALRHFEPVSFIRKSCGPPLIGMLAERILVRFRVGPEVKPC